MKQRVTSNHWLDHNGKPAGGASYGDGFAISWQNGPLGRDSQRKAPNGAFVEGVIQAAMDRIQWYQSTGFACEENQEAILHLSIALKNLEARTQDREARLVEGTHTV